MPSPFPYSLFPTPCSLLLPHFQHPVQRNFSPALDAGTDLNAVDDAALDQVFQNPAQRLPSDAVHGGAEAASVVESDDALVLACKAAAHAVDQVNFRADGEHCARGSLLDEGDQLLGGTEGVGFLADLPAALGVNDDLDAGVPGAHLIDVAGQKTLMDSAVSLPQEDAACGQMGQALASGGLAALERPRVPDGHFVQGNAHGMTRIAAQVLVRQEEDAFTSGKGPLEGGAG